MDDEATEGAPKKRGRPAKAESFPCTVLRDYWTEGGDRIAKGTVIAATASDAMDGVAAGTLSRVK